MQLELIIDKFMKLDRLLALLIMRACVEWSGVVVHQRWLITLQGLPDSGRAWDENVSRRLLQDAEHGTVDALSGLCDDMHWNLSLEHRDDLFICTGSGRVP